VSDLRELLDKDGFSRRHLGPDGGAQREMLATLGAGSLDALVREVVPQDILLEDPLALGEAKTEAEALAEISAHAGRNELWRNFIGTGYYGTHTPAVIQRNVFENPGWYTAYTPYQAEISNASLLDEATAAAEAMAMIRRSSKSKATKFFVDAAVHPQVLAVMRTRAKWLGIELLVGDDFRPGEVFGAHLQYPDTLGRVRDFSPVIAEVHKAQGLVSLGTDLLALMLLRSPGALGADIAVGSAQRFGVPMGYGGPHAAFMACRDEYKRSMPGRIIGVSVDAAGRP
jgi:glycine dehydrogenase